MSGNRRVLWLGGGGLALFLAYATLSAAPGGGENSRLGPPHGHPHGPPGPVRNMLMGHMGRMMVLHSEINITPQQHDQLFGIMKGHHSEVQPVAKGLVVAVRNLRDKMIGDQSQEAEIRAAANELGKAIGDAAVLVSKGVGEAKAIMTPDQLALVKKFLAEEDRAQDKFLEEMKKLPDFPRPQ